MQNFHDHKLWQDSFVALMDIHDIVDGLDRTDNKETIEALVTDAQNVAAKIADGLSRNDHRIARDLLFDAVGLVAVTRTQLAVCWGRELVNDDTFRAVDNKYAELTNALQNFK